MIKIDFEKQYAALLQTALNSGEVKSNRTGIDALSLFNKSMTIDLRDGFPILTGKKMFFNKALTEYIWMMEGMVTTKYLKENGVHWWDEFADDNGYLGKTYGYQMRNFNGEIDQLDYIHRQIRMDSRRAHLTIWNPSDLKCVKLPPCYTGFTFMTLNGRLNMSIQLRSSDMFLGLPYDIMVAALILTDVAIFNDLIPGELGLQITDGHVYTNHRKAVEIYLSQNTYELPKLITSLDSKWKLTEYKHGPFIGAKLNN